VFLATFLSPKFERVGDISIPEFRDFSPRAIKKELFR